MNRALVITLPCQLQITLAIVAYRGQRAAARAKHVQRQLVAATDQIAGIAIAGATISAASATAPCQRADQANAQRQCAETPWNLRPCHHISLFSIADHYFCLMLKALNKIYQHEIKMENVCNTKALFRAFSQQFCLFLSAKQKIKTARYTKKS
ncbi:hypothetical protein [Chromobacterium amazonense]|uniref:ESPR domain-containing protein n=1 Tax=Chromobacterium amazonense TaxID=1382803 RepID=A0ABU8V5R6_9NEIS|nr:hypothetical protein [Chromobacterium amazonense]MDQ4540728.1 hypothetical protein [Chromobacterium amazonense]